MTDWHEDVSFSHVNCPSVVSSKWSFCSCFPVSWEEGKHELHHLWGRGGPSQQEQCEDSGSLATHTWAVNCLVAEDVVEVGVASPSSS